MYQDTFNNGNVANMSVEDKQRARKRSQEIKKVGTSDVALYDWVKVGGQGAVQVARCQYTTCGSVPVLVPQKAL